MESPLLRNNFFHGQEIMFALGGGKSPVRAELHYENDLENWKFSKINSQPPASHRLKWLRLQLNQSCDTLLLFQRVGNFHGPGMVFPP